MIDYSARFTNENNEWFFKSIDDMVKDTGIKKRNLQYSLKSLKEKGLIQSCRAFNKPNNYKVIFDKCDEIYPDKTDISFIEEENIPKDDYPQIIELLKRQNELLENNNKLLEWILQRIE